jgi:hypothetical protein
VQDCHIIKTHANGGAGDTLELKNVANVIGTVVCNVNDTLRADVPGLNDAYHDVAEGALFSITATKATSSQMIAYIDIQPI